MDYLAPGLALCIFLLFLLRVTPTPATSATRKKKAPLEEKKPESLSRTINIAVTIPPDPLPEKLKK